MKEAVLYFLSFKSYVVLPVIIFMLAMVFRIKMGTAIKSSLMIGVGFIGIFMTFDYFIAFINPVVKALVERTGLQLNVLDAGWPPLAAMTWSFELAPVLLFLFMGINIVMLMLKITKTVNIDIWNYWHLILAAAMIFHATESPVLSVLIPSLAFVMVLKLAEWTAPLVNEFSGMEGICIPHLAALVHYPYALFLNRMMDRIPKFNQIDAKPEQIQARFGILGEPMMIGLTMGIALGIGGGYNFKETSELAVNFAAVIYILPKMAGILGGALIPISEGMKTFIADQFPELGTTYIGLDVAVLFGIPSVLVTSLLLIPISLIGAFVLPGINFIPLGELANLVVPVALITVATKGNVIRGVIIGVPMVISSLYIASGFAEFYTSMAARYHFSLVDYSGVFTSFLDGGNYFRAWMVELSHFSVIGIVGVPVIAIMVYYTRKATKEELE